MNRGTKRKKLTSVLIKPAGPDCNMACTYCFYLKKAGLFPQTKIHRMSDEILEETVRQVMTQGQRTVSFAWQGGEPTLMGLPFYRRAVELQQLYGRGQTVGNGLQTNGLLLDEEWAGFLSDYNFLVGLSLDGPQHIHDRYRHLRNGQGSWAYVASKARLLLDKGVATNALSVITDYSANYPDEIYEFHKSLGLNYMQFITCLEPDPADPSRVAPFSVPAEKYGRFLTRLFDLWLDDFDGQEAKTSVRFFDSIFHIYAGLEPPDCTLHKECGEYLVIEHNGDVYACDFFVEPRWKLGNIVQGRLIDMLNSAAQRKFGKIKADLPEECLRCRWLRFCRGGCPRDRFHNPSNRRLNYFCAAFKAFFEHADPAFRKLAEDWKRRQTAAGL